MTKKRVQLKRNLKKRAKLSNLAVAYLIFVIILISVFATAITMLIVFAPDIIQTATAKTKEFFESIIELIQNLFK